MKEDFAELIGPVARLLLGEPNKALSSKTELRYGSRGSLAIDLQKGVWHDHELGQGGGVLDLVQRETGLIEKQRLQWLEDAGFHLEREQAPQANGGAGKPQFKIVATYPYVDEAGELLFEVCRLEPKDFRQRKPDPQGRDGWSWSVKGVRNVPYRLPDLVEAIAMERTVFVVEGEKDADRLHSLGIPTTCNAGGAGKWRNELTEHFADADVVVIPDHDPQKKHPKTGELMFHPDGRPILPGQDHAHAIAQALDGTARRVRVLNLEKFWPEMPPKGDVSDWLDRGGGNFETLYDIIERIPDWSPEQAKEPPAPLVLTLINIRLWYGVEPKPRQWVVRERIPARNVTLLTGQGGVGKTLLMQQLSVATVLGKDWIGELPEFGPVLFITAEDDEDELHFRYAQITKHYSCSFNDLDDLHLMSLAGKDATMAIADNRGMVKPTELFERLKNTARAIRPRWIGLDTAADIFVVNERDRSQVRQCISLLRGLALEIETAVILLAHPSLTGISSGSGLSGSTAWNNSVRSRLYLKVEKKKDGSEKDYDQAEDDPDQHIEDDGAVRILETMKSNYAGIGAPIRLVWKNGLLLPEQTLAKLAPLDRAALDDKARAVFLQLLERYNRQNLVVSYKERARNFAPAEFAKLPETKELHRSLEQRKRLLRHAMDYLLAKDNIQTGFGPQGLPRSKQNECLYKGGTLL